MAAVAEHDVPRRAALYCVAGLGAGNDPRPGQPGVVEALRKGVDPCDGEAAVAGIVLEQEVLELVAADILVDDCRIAVAAAARPADL